METQKIPWNIWYDAYDGRGWGGWLGTEEEVEGWGGKPSWWRPACQLVGGVRGGGVFSKITVLDTLVLKSSMWFIHVWVVFTEPLTSRKTVITVEQVLKLWLHLYKFTCCLPFNDFQEAKTKRCGALSLLRMHSLSMTDTPPGPSGQVFMWHLLQALAIKHKIRSPKRIQDWLKETLNDKVRSHRIYDLTSNLESEDARLETCFEGMFLAHPFTRPLEYYIELLMLRTLSET